MAISVVALLILLVLGLIGLGIGALLIILSAKAIGGKKGSGGGLAGVGIIIVLLVLFVGLAFVGLVVPYTVQRGDYANSHSGESIDHYEDGRRLASNVRINPQQFAIDVEAMPQSHKSDFLEVQEFQTEPSAPNGGIDESPDITIAGRPWTDAVEEFQDFEADVYPSLEAAAEALGRRVGQRMMSVSDADNTEPKSIYVWREGVEGEVYIKREGYQAMFPGHGIPETDLVISRTVLEAVASGLRQKIDDPAYVSVEPAPTEDRRQNTLVKVVLQEIVFENHNRWRSHAESRNGAIALRVETSGGPFSVSTRFVDAGWVEDRSGFARAYTNGDWLVGYSDSTHSSHEEARRDAILAASDALLPLAQARINRLSGADQHRFAQQMAKDPNWLRDKVADELVSRNLATDRFAQRFDRSYGPVWREAVLVNASPHRIEEIARSLVQGVDAKVTSHRITWLSYVALVALVFGTYLFLNIATKGYYAWTLRAAAVIGIVGMIFFFRTVG